MTSRVSWTQAGDGLPSDELVPTLISIAIEPESAANWKGGHSRLQLPHRPKHISGQRISYAFIHDPME
jgi:hypothetical protein